MARLDRVKRRVVRAAVRENLDLIEGVIPRRRRRRFAVLTMAARVIFLVGLPAAVFASSYVLSNVAERWLAESRASRADPRYRPAASPFLVREVAPPSVEARDVFDPPRPLDPRVFPLTVRRVVLDPGHGGDNTGTEAPGGLVEKELTLDVARRLRRLLERYGYEVVMTRDADESLSLQRRAQLANEARGDVFVSIHVNWIETRGVRGVETYYLGRTEDPYLTELTARENRNSGFSLADVREILERVYADVRQEESRALAEAVQSSLHESVRKVNRQVRNRGVKRAPFVVLTETEMPAILAEISCVSNASEARLLLMPSYRQYLAEALFKGIESYARGLNPTRTAEGRSEGGPDEPLARPTGG